MSELNFEETQLIINTLREKGAKGSCPVCGVTQFTMFDACFKHSNNDYSFIPFVVLVCKNCGYMSQHVLGTLGLLDKIKIGD